MLDLITLTQFEDELRRVARFTGGSAIADPIAAALKVIRDHPARNGSRLLGRVLRALCERTGQFRQAEISAFDSPTLKIVLALLDAARDNTNSERQWHDAAAAADSALA